MKLVIPGKPIAKKRPKFFRKGNFVGAYNPQTTEEGRWLWSASNQINHKMSNYGIEISMLFLMPIPKSASKKVKSQMAIGQIQHTKTPDLDNLEKFVLDCLNGIAWDDDSQIIAINSRKLYTNTEARTIIEIKEVKP